MSPVEVDAFVRVCATITWLVIGVFLLAMALDRRGPRD